MAKRRPPGTGSISARPDGRWLVRVELGEDVLTGERRRESRVVKGTKKEAELVRDELRAARRHIGPDLSLGSLLDEWRATVTLEAGTVRNYDRAQKLIPAHMLAARARDIDPSTIDRFYRALLADGTSIHAVLGVHTILCAAYAQAEKWWGMPNVTRRTSPPARPKATRNTRGLREFDPARLLAAARTPLEQVWLAIHMTTGARRSEVLALRWSDIDLDTGIVTIAQALDPVTRQRKATKTGDIRRLPIDATTVAMIRRWRSMAAERALSIGASLPADSYIISDKVDCSAPWNPDAASKRFQRLVIRAGMNGPTLHGLRSALGTILVAAGVDPKTVQHRLGHARLTTTMDIYARSLPLTERAAGETIGAIVHAVNGK